MKLPGIFKQRKMRGKSKSPEAKLREKKAMVDTYLLDSWLKNLRQNPELAARISEQRFGSEGVMPHYGEGGDYESPDLLDVLRQAREAKDLLKDEINTKGSWLSDLATIMKALPEVLGSLPQIQQIAQQQQQFNPNPTKYIQQPHEQGAQIQPQPQKFDLNMEAVIPLIELEPADAWEQLQVNGEAGWIHYLSHTSLEEIEKLLAQYAQDSEIPMQADGIRLFLQQKHHWLAELVELAHSAGQS